VLQGKLPWSEPYGRFSLFMERHVIGVLHACKTV
jgi:transposase